MLMAWIIDFKGRGLTGVRVNAAFATGRSAVPLKTAPRTA